MAYEAKFKAAAAIIQKLPKSGPVQPTDEDKLIFYRYYKQVDVGDCNVPPPSAFQFTEKAKWKAWNEVKGMSKAEAEQKYVEHFIKMFKGHEGDDNFKEFGKAGTDKDFIEVPQKGPAGMV